MRDRAPRESSPPRYQTQEPKTVIDEQSPTCASEYSLQSLVRTCWPLPATRYQQEHLSVMDIYHAEPGLPADLAFIQLEGKLGD